MRFFKGLLKAIAIVPIAAYLLYVVAIAIFFNTPIFRSVAEMTDDGKTYVKVDGGWSLIPGVLHAATIHVNVREPDVELDIPLERATVTFDFKPLFRKRVHVRKLQVAETSVAIRTKTPPPDAPEPVESAEERERRIAIEEQRKLRDRWIIKVFDVELPNITRVSLGDDVLRARKISVFGSFMIQPGTQCEIYPSTFTVEDGRWNDEITSISLNARARFHHFRKPWLTGSEVMRYLDAHLEGTASAKDLKFVNVTLRSLGDYGFGRGSANLRTAVDVRAGRIQGGSMLRADRSSIRIAGPRFEAAGQGRIAWEADRGSDTSRLEAVVTDARTRVHLGSNRMTGTVAEIRADAKILGLDLLHAFTGLSARLRVRDGRIVSIPMPDDRKSGIQYRGSARIAGELTAVAGNYPASAGVPKPSGFAVELDDTEVRFPKLGTVTGGGRVSFSLKPIDFRRGRAELPNLKIAYHGEIDGKYPFTLGWTSVDSSRVFGLKTADNHWRGSGTLRITQFDGILDYLRETKKISAIERAGLNATEMHTGIAWDVTGEDARLDVIDLGSNGIWSGRGSLLSEKEPDGDSKLSGAFRGKLLGIPVNIDIGKAAAEEETRKE